MTTAAWLQCTTVIKLFESYKTLNILWVTDSGQTVTYMPCTCARVATYLRRRVEVIKCGFSHWAETATRLRTSQLWKWPQLESVAKKYLFSWGTPHTVLVSDSTFIAERTSGVIRMGTLRLRLPGTWMRSMLYYHKQVNFADTHIQHSLVI